MHTHPPFVFSQLLNDKMEVERRVHMEMEIFLKDNQLVSGRGPRLQHREPLGVPGVNVLAMRSSV